MPRSNDVVDKLELTAGVLRQKQCGVHQGWVTQAIREINSLRSGKELQTALDRIEELEEQIRQRDVELARKEEELRDLKLKASSYGGYSDLEEPERDA